MLKGRNILHSLLFIQIIALFSACTGKLGNNSNIGEDQLFTLKYGSFDNELTLFNLNQVGEIHTNLAMQGGFFYIANGEAKKIIELTSYGNLLSIFYNEDCNPTPSFAEKDEKAKNVTQRAIVYPFNELGAIAIDSRKYMYVVDTLPIERQQQDTKRGLHLDKIILRFDENGNFIDYIGQQGPGGDPFSTIKNIYTNEDNELIVVSYTQEGLDTYWFSTDGYMTYTIHTVSANIPNPLKKSLNVDTFVSLDTIVPDRHNKKLYLKVDYYTSSVDAASNVQAGIDYNTTLIYPLDVNKGVYDDPIEISPYIDTASNGLSKVEYDQPYNFLGVTESGWLFFIDADSTGYTVQMVQINGQRVIKRHFDVDHGKILYHTFSLSNTGRISALFAKKDSAIINWWKTDQLIDAILKN